jgi:hypothetical protein
MTAQNDAYVIAFTKYLEELNESAGIKMKIYRGCSPDCASPKSTYACRVRLFTGERKPASLFPFSS